MSTPIPRKDMDFTKPFIYDRHFGFFYVVSGYHEIASATLWFFHNSSDLSGRLGNLEIDAEKWLKMPGTCFKSSVNDQITVGLKGNLSFYELQWFKDFKIDYILED